MKTPPSAHSLASTTLSLREAARKLGIPLAALRERLGRGELPFEQIAGEIRIPGSACRRKLTKETNRQRPMADATDSRDDHGSSRRKPAVKKLRRS